MSKMRIFKFWGNENGTDEKEKRNVKFEKRDKPSENDYKDRPINVEYVTKKERKQISTSVNIPLEREN